MLTNRHQISSLASLLLLATLCGCVNGPLRLGKYRPDLQKEWKLDEAYGPTIHDKLAELEGLRVAAPTLSPAVQQEKSRELLELLRNEKNALLLAPMVRTLACFSTEESLEALRWASTHGNSDVRIAACKGWNQKGGAEAAEALATTLGSDTDPDVRIAAARAMAKFRDPTVVRALGDALESPDPALQYRCVQSLKKVTGRDYGDSVPAWREFVQSGQAKPAVEESLAQRLFSWF